MIEETNRSSLCVHRHIFIDAKTGTILWRTKMEYFHEPMGCINNRVLRYPENTLMDSYSTEKTNFSVV